MEFITDRTQGDVTRRQELARKGIANMTDSELAEWLAPSKGAYNYTDLNRVNAAVAYLGEMMNAMGYRAALYPTREWTAADIPTETDISQYVQNIQNIRKAFYMISTMPNAPASAMNFTHVDANNIEKILLDAEMLLSKIPAGYKYSGEMYGGDVL